MKRRRLGKMPMGARQRRGGVAVEMAISIALMLAMSIGITSIAAAVMSHARDMRAVRAGLDLAWQLDTETSAPSAAQLDAIAAAMAEIAVDDAAEYGMRATVVNADSAGTHGVRWTGTSGDLSVPVRVQIDSGAVTVDGATLTLADDEKLVVVVWNARRASSGPIAALGSRDSVLYGVKRDPETGP